MTNSNTTLAQTEEPWPLLGGADIELGNFMTGHDATHSDAAAKAILAEVDGISARSVRVNGFIQQFIRQFVRQRIHRIHLRAAEV